MLLLLAELIILSGEFLPVVLDLDHRMVGSVLVGCRFAVLAEMVIADGAFVPHSFDVGLRTHAAGESLVDAITNVALCLLAYFG